MILSRERLLYAALSLVAAFFIVMGLNQQPGYTDAFYHYNAAEQIAKGEGFIDHYLWTYIGAPDELPAPSHLYWMPGTSIIAAAGMSLFGIRYWAAQIGFAFCLWGAGLVAYCLGWCLGGTKRHAWQAGILALFGGFFMRFWGQMDTFAPYALLGSLSLVFLGLGITVQKHGWFWWLLAGICTALGHLVRTDGLLLLLVGWAILLWPFDVVQKKSFIHQRLQWLLIFTATYLLMMLPWMLRNVDAIGTPLPVGGTQAVWYSEYNDLFNFPPDPDPQLLFQNRFSLLVESRMWALFSGSGALVNFIAVEGSIVLAPLILIALWLRRRDRFLRPVWLFALGIHLAFSLVFPFPGVRGGLFHAAAALVPIWAVLGLIGLDDMIDWMASKRRRWNARTAKFVFSTGIVLIVLILSLSVALPGRIRVRSPQFYQTLRESLPDEARVMINDPSQLFYYTGLSGVVVPNEAPDVALQIAKLYDVDFLVLESGGIPQPMVFDQTPGFLTVLDVQLGGASVYAFKRD